MWVIVPEGQCLLKDGTSYPAGSEVELADADAIVLIERGQAIARPDPESGDKYLSGNPAGSNGEGIAPTIPGGDAVHSIDPPDPVLPSGSPETAAAPGPGESAGEVEKAPEIENLPPSGESPQAAPPPVKGGRRKGKK
jgi:hypothetical protein